MHTPTENNVIQMEESECILAFWFACVCLKKAHGNSLLFLDSQEKYVGTWCLSDTCSLEAVLSFVNKGEYHLALKKKQKKNKDHGIWWDYSSVTDRQGAVSHFGYVHIRSRSMVPPDQCHFRRSNTQTDPSDALAPTLSPVAFQQTSKMPPVPR